MELCSEEFPCPNILLSEAAISDRALVLMNVGRQLAVRASDVMPFMILIVAKGNLLVRKRSEVGRAFLKLVKAVHRNAAKVLS